MTLLLSYCILLDYNCDEFVVFKLRGQLRKGSIIESGSTNKIPAVSESTAPLEKKLGSLKIRLHVPKRSTQITKAKTDSKPQGAKVRISAAAVESTYSAFRLNLLNESFCVEWTKPSETAGHLPQKSQEPEKELFSRCHDKIQRTRDNENPVTPIELKIPKLILKIGPKKSADLDDSRELAKVCERILFRLMVTLFYRNSCNPWF